MQELLIQHGLHIDTYPPRAIVPEQLVQAIVQNSKQDHIRATTPDDELVRFANREAFYDWFARGKLLFALIETESRTLAGIGWFSQQSNAHAKYATHTYAHRLYEGFTGKGLSTPFAAALHALAREHIGAGPYWLSVRSSNSAAIRTYENIGYSTVLEQGDRRIMIRDEEAV